jgi:hypothetical protein
VRRRAAGRGAPAAGACSGRPGPGWAAGPRLRAGPGGWLPGAACSARPDAAPPLALPPAQMAVAERDQLQQRCDELGAEVAQLKEAGERQVEVGCCALLRPAEPSRLRSSACGARCALRGTAGAGAGQGPGCG